MSESWVMLTLRTKRRALKTGTQKIFEKLHFEHRRSERKVHEEELLGDFRALSPEAEAILTRRIQDVREAKTWLLDGLDPAERLAFEASWIFDDYAGDQLWIGNGDLVEALVPEEYTKSRKEIFLSFMRGHDAMVFLAFLKMLFRELGFDEIDTHMGSEYEDDDE